MKLCALVLLLTASVCVRADLWDDIKGGASDAAGFFKDKFTDFKSLFASNYEDLKTNVGNTETLLTNLEAKKDDLMEDADSTQKAALNKVSGWKTDVTAFKNRVETQGKDKFATLKDEWKTKVESMFKTGNLSELVALANGAGHVSLSLMAVLAAFAAFLLLQH